MLTNWKTTSAGVAALLAGLSTLFSHLSTDITSGVFDVTQLATDFSTIIAGIGLITAKDFNVTGGTNRQ